MPSQIPVGLIGHNGRVGSAVLTALLKRNDLRVVVLHRPESDVTSIPAGMEKRVLDLEKGSPGEIEKAIEGLQVVISAVTTLAAPSQSALLPALAKSKSLITFIPSEYGAPWREKEDFGVPGLAFLQGKETVAEQARDRGVPITTVKSGTFAGLWFSPVFGINVKENKIQLYGDAKTLPGEATSVPYLAEGIAQLVSHPTSLPNRTFSFLEYSPTGDELAEILTSLHGSQTVLEEYTEEQFEHDVQRGGLDAVVAGLKRLWGQEHEYPNVTQVEGFQSVPLEEFLRASLRK
ncbi:hypothetical protein JCM24511_06899 [Saitozyma sp. JCM 24511]|nr:hypothetical protein JCM24511_06899 [Saitozyma sp. JCM 24511]